MKIFISYASEDRKQAEAIAVRLKQEDHEVYFDRSSLEPAQGYDEALRDFVARSDLFLFLLSPDSVQKGRYTLTELKFAYKRWPNPRGKILPVMARKTPIDSAPSFLQAIGILEAEGNLAAEVLAEVDRLQAERVRKRNLRIGGLITAVAAIGIVVAFLIPDRPPDPIAKPVDQPTGQVTDQPTDSPANQPGDQSVNPPPDGSGETAEQPGSSTPVAETDVDSCGKLTVLQNCGIDLARSICAAYTALESGELFDMAAADVDFSSRSGNFLYTKNADNQAEIQFLDNVTHAYQQSGGEDVRFAEFGDPRSFWRDTTDASLVLSTVINEMNREIPDGESSIYYGKAVPLSIPFRVEGSQWRRARNIHGAAFAYFSAISATDAESMRDYLELAVDRMTDVCAE